MSRYFKVTACVPSLKRVRVGRELQNTFYTKLVPYENWFSEQQRIQKAGGKIISVELFSGTKGANTGVGA
jgi:phycobilisome core linker protein